jgi:predicted nucleic acid-binding Zn ribbon protein
MDWNIAARQSLIPEAELTDLQQRAVDLLDILQKNLPDKTGEKAKWNFEKAHSIFHKVREIILWSNSDNTSCQAPEVCTNR